MRYLLVVFKSCRLCHENLYAFFLCPMCFGTLLHSYLCKLWLFVATFEQGFWLSLSSSFYHMSNGFEVFELWTMALEVHLSSFLSRFLMPSFWSKLVHSKFHTSKLVIAKHSLSRVEVWVCWLKVSLVASNLSFFFFGCLFVLVVC